MLKLQQEEDGHACVLKGADGHSDTEVFPGGSAQCGSTVVALHTQHTTSL